MSKLCNLYKNALPGVVKFLEIEYDSPAKPQYEYVDHTIVINLRRDEIYMLDRYHKLMISVSSNGVIAFSDCKYFQFIDDGHTLSILFKNNAYSRNLSIEVEGNDIGNVKFTELSNATGYTAINPFMETKPDKNIFGYISKNPTIQYIQSGASIYIACLSYSSYIVSEQNNANHCLLNGDPSYVLPNLTLSLDRKITKGDSDLIYIYKVTATGNTEILLH